MKKSNPTRPLLKIVPASESPARKVSLTVVTDRWTPPGVSFCRIAARQRCIYVEQAAEKWKQRFKWLFVCWLLFALVLIWMSLPAIKLALGVK